SLVAVAAVAVVAATTDLDTTLLKLVSSEKENITTETTTPTVEEPTQEEVSTPVETPAETPTADDEVKENKVSTLTINLGNDIGHNISALSVRQNANAQWTEIPLDNGVWQSGYIIPVTLEGSDIPLNGNEWQVQVSFVDEMESMVFDGLTFTDGGSLILTEEGVF
ncbi:MAG: hypothetical protein ACRCW1_01595, partial [Anaerotignaceae bacterium]